MTRVGRISLRYVARAAGMGLALMMLSMDRATAEDGRARVDAEVLSQQVTIYRDEYGVPHIFGETDESVIFGFGYAQAEDHFWQVEDVYILALGRYSEVHGPKGLNSDLLNRGFEIVRTSKRDFAALDKQSKKLYAAFVAGINQYLANHPEVKPRLIEQFEPWHVLAYYRHVALELCFRFTGIESSYLPRRNPPIWAAGGSNGWAISGSRTASGNPMLLANPHMPWFGFSQMMEAHLASEGKPDGVPWNFIGGGFYGCPMLAMGHNDRLGWTLVSNEPNIADCWEVQFTHPENPLAYEYDGDWRYATEWHDEILVKKSRFLETRKFTFRKTHHGPIVAKVDGNQQHDVWLAARISGLYETIPLRQSLQMVKAQNLAEFRRALTSLQILYMNILYADCDGNIWFVYTGRVPRRNPAFDWFSPVDGSDPSTEWVGNHGLDELPQVLNPPAGFLQNCNSTPLITTDGENPLLEDFPPYMIGDADQFRRRALRSLEILRPMKNITFEDLQQMAFDTECYWARHELPQLVALARETLSNTELLEKASPYLDHLLQWDAQITLDCDSAAIALAWYEILYGRMYPGEEMLKTYQDQPARQLRALLRAAERLQTMHGTWKVPYGEAVRIQRQPRVADVLDIRFNDSQTSLPTNAGHGPMGVLFTQYSTPSIQIPLVISQRRRYGIVGTSYMATYEFAPDGVKGASLVPFGSSGNPSSPHFFDQAELLSQRRLKAELFDKEQVIQNAVRSYRPASVAN